MKLAFMQHIPGGFRRILDTSINSVAVRDDRATVYLDEANALSLYKQLRERFGNDNKPNLTRHAFMHNGTEYNSVVGFLQDEQPEILELVRGDEREATVRDGFWLKHQCKKRGFDVIKVAAPSTLREDGISSVNAYPVMLLRERFKS